MLEDGTLFPGFSFGYEGEATGESCFNTVMSGYQEIITDPSYAGQIVAMTYPLIGNYGANSADLESPVPVMRGLVVREYSRIYENRRAEESLEDFLIRHKIPGIEGVDTRRLTRHIRDLGAMRCILSSGDFDPKSLLTKVLASPQMSGSNLAGSVTTRKAYVFSENQKYKVIAYDFGVKRNILSRLTAAGCAVTVVPAETPAEEVLAQKPDGVFLSNGPGDPAAVTYAIANTRRLIESGVPLFGICLGHQIICLALGAKTFKLKYGHRGGNQPVMNLATRRVEITAQNHGFAVDPASLQDIPAEITYVNLNDQTVEGIAHKTKPVFAVQYHPEASPGPHDAGYLFTKFTELMAQRA